MLKNADTLKKRRVTKMHIDSRPNRRLDEEDSIGKVTGFFLFRNIINSYNDDKDKAEDERKTLKKYGRIAFILSIISLVLSISCLIFRLGSYGAIGVNNVIVNIFYIIGGIVVGLGLGLYGFVFGVMQVRLNRKSIGIISLIASILSVLSALFLIIALFIF